MSRAEQFDTFESVETKQLKVINAAFSDKAKKKTFKSIRKQSFNNKVNIQDLDDLRNKSNHLSSRRGETNLNIKWVKSKQVTTQYQ